MSKSPALLETLTHAVATTAKRVLPPTIPRCRSVQQPNSTNENEWSKYDNNEREGGREKGGSEGQGEQRGKEYVWEWERGGKWKREKAGKQQHRVLREVHVFVRDRMKQNVQQKQDGTALRPEVSTCQAETRSPRSKHTDLLHVCMCLSLLQEHMKLKFFTSSKHFTHFTVTTLT